MFSALAFLKRGIYDSGDYSGLDTEEKFLTRTKDLAVIRIHKSVHLMNLHRILQESYEGIRPSRIIFSPLYQNKCLLPASNIHMQDVFVILYIKSTWLCLSRWPELRFPIFFLKSKILFKGKVPKRWIILTKIVVYDKIQSVGNTVQTAQRPYSLQVTQPA